MNERLTVIIPAWSRYLSFLPNLLNETLPRQGVEVRTLVVGPPEADEWVAGGAELVPLASGCTVGAARNRGLDAVKTELVTFLDADDVLAPGSLRRLLDLHDRYGDEPVVVAGSMVAWHPSVERAIPLPFPTPTALHIQGRELLLASLMLVKNSFPVVGPAIVRTSAARQAGGFSDMRFGEDWGLATALAFRGRVLLTGEPLMRYRFHRGSEINQAGTPAGILRSRVELVRRWYRDPAIPLALRIALPVLSFPRMALAVKRLFQGQNSHDDVLALLREGAPMPQLTLDPDPKPGAVPTD